MVKKIRYQENRAPCRRRDMREIWLLEPLDGALIGAAVALILWLQWIAHAS